ncbi:unnamed protein product [Withania somnifera]
MHALIRKSAAVLIRANSHFIHISTSTAPSIKQTGLYGYRHLKTPKGFQQFVDDAIERSEELVNYIAGMPSSPEIIRAMDEISDTVCSVIDSAELCRHTHPDREFVDEASKASLRVNEFLHVRKVAYVQGNSVPHANLEVLDKLIAARHEFAQLMGCKSYAEFALHSTMAASPEVVVSFLLEMSKVVRPKADQEFQEIQNFKREYSGDPNAELEPWDEAYFMCLMKSATYKLDSSVVASYFPLRQCIEGLKVLVESLFGVTFHGLPLAPGESWHPDVMKIVLHHPTEANLGYLYLDLKSRKGKHPICAHFAIRGGRRVSETEYQLPVVALVCNFSGSSLAPVRLNHSEVETLFHEFGHALHSLLSRTEYQHFSGTRVVLDFAETPSNLFESYAWDYRVLKTFAKHYSTGDIIPKELVESMVGSKDMFAATELQRQIFYALFDQTLFGEQPSTGRDTIAIVADLKRQHTSWTHVDGTHWHTRFSHLTNYGAGYYSYLYAKCFATSIWQRICQEDPLSLDTGSALRTKFLQHGGAKDPADILNDLVGSGIIRSCNGGIIPDITSLCEEMGLLKC